MLRKILRFGLSGGAATATHLLVAWLVFTLVIQRADVANAAAFVVANIVSYVLHTLWSFSSRMGARQLVRFLGVSAVGLGLSTLIPAMVGHDRLWLGTLAVTLIVPPVTFVLHNSWTYRQEQ
ncbi:GtrA family protein [Cupriavidus sp. DF5525]|uniref:GtrA family protein n=1 Tax=Cupriavidus sp. DF5525 TaxID=3160989 RepID=UPI0032DF6740